MASKEIFYQGLSDLNVLIEDTSLASPDYFRILKMPSELTLGINTFRFSGNADLFEENTPIYVEILDYNGNPVYYETSIDTNSAENIAIVSIYITEKTPPGQGTVIICSTAQKSAKGDILDTSKINVRWKYSIYINTDKRNETGRPLFYVYPQTLYTTFNTANLQKSSGPAGDTVAEVLNSGSFSNSYVSWSLAVNQPVYIFPFGLSKENAITVYTSAIGRRDTSVDPPAESDCNVALLIRITAWLIQTGSVSYTTSTSFNSFGNPLTGSSNFLLGSISGSIISGSTALSTGIAQDTGILLPGGYLGVNDIRVSDSVKSVIYLPTTAQDKIIYVRVEYATFRLPYNSTTSGGDFNFSLRLGNIIGIIGSSPETDLEVAAQTGNGIYYTTYVAPAGGGDTIVGSGTYNS
jgi:hypothetical protein